MKVVIETPESEKIPAKNVGRSEKVGANRTRLDVKDVAFAEQKESGVTEVELQDKRQLFKLKNTTIIATYDY